jgi:hypothetical protein
VRFNLFARHTKPASNAALTVVQVAGSGVAVGLPEMVNVPKAMGSLPVKGLMEKVPNGKR